MDGDQRESGPNQIQTLLATSAAAERRLLKQERKAERQLAESRAALAAERRRLAIAQERVERRLNAVVAAEEALWACQTRRAGGPSFSED